MPLALVTVSTVPAQEWVTLTPSWPSCPYTYIYCPVLAVDPVGAVLAGVALLAPERRKLLGGEVGVGERVPLVALLAVVSLVALGGRA